MSGYPVEKTVYVENGDIVEYYLFNFTHNKYSLYYMDTKAGHKFTSGWQPITDKELQILKDSLTKDEVKDLIK